MLLARHDRLRPWLLLALAACNRGHIPSREPTVAEEAGIITPTEAPGSQAALDTWIHAGPHCVPQARCMSFGSDDCAEVGADGTMVLSPGTPPNVGHSPVGTHVDYRCSDGACFHSVNTGPCISNFPNTPKYRCAFVEGSCRSLGSFVTPRR